VSFHPRDRISIFGSLRPRKGQLLSRAVVATYSLDLVAMLGLVLALGGDGEEEFESSPLEFVNAVEKVRGRLLVLHQLGRVIAPGRHRSVLPLLDTMLRAVPADERRESWHPKVALASYELDGTTEWRLWIGSRNLTGSGDLEAGLLLVSGSGRGAKVLKGVAELATGLLPEADWTPAEVGQLRTARWIAPPGVSVRRLLWRRPGQAVPFLDGPLLARATRVCAVSPFIDNNGLAVARAAARVPLTLLTTRRAGSCCAPLDGVRFRTATSPEPDIEVAVERQREEADGDFTDPPASGVHAKLLAAERSGKAVLLLGSANLTGRGLLGPNAEAAALLDVTDPALSSSLFDFVDGGMELIPEPPDEAREELAAEERRLDGLVSRFLQRPMTLTLGENGLVLTVKGGVDDLLEGARLSAAPFLDPERRAEWVRGSASVRLLPTPPPAHEQTAFLTLRAQSRTRPEVVRSWVQRFELAGLDAERRDRVLLARYIGAQRFRDWLRSLLEDIEPVGGRGRWYDPVPEPQPPGGLPPDLFALETLLGGWARDPSAFEARISRIIAMLDSFQETFEALPDGSERSAALEDLSRVRPFLTALEQAVSEADS